MIDEFIAFASLRPLHAHITSCLSSSPMSDPRGLEYSTEPKCLFAEVHLSIDKLLLVLF